MKNILQKIGLTEQQTKVYLKLLELGPSSVGKIIKQLDIERVSCYDTLNRLISKGLVNFVKSKGTRLYQAVDPERLLKIVEEEEEKAKEKKKEIQKVLPQLLKMKEFGLKEDSEANVYKTKEGIKSIFELMLKEKKEIKVISATGRALQEMKHYFPQWHKKREKEKIKVKVVFNKELEKKKITKIPYSKIKFLSKEHSSPATLFIFGDYVINLLWEDVPFAFLIKSKGIAKSYENYFKIIWRIAQ